jgi:hypothetical protein
MQTTDIRYSLTRHDVAHDCTQTEVPVVDSPAIGAAAAAALRNRVNDRRDAAAAPVRWYAGDSGTWAAVTDLHRRGQHDDALELASFLYWTERRAVARDHVVWTLTTS